MRNKSRLLAIVAAQLLAFAALPATAQDPAVVNPKTVHVKLENARVRVLDAVLGAGQREQMHSHPSCVIYVVAGGTVRSHLADGTVKESVLKTGDVISRDPVTHWTENIGRRAIHLIIVELKPD